jgi:membrane protease YdiL (CAAX protease family)
MAIPLQAERNRNIVFLYSGLAFLATLALSGVFAWVNIANYNWLSPLFERSSNHTIWGILQRWFLIVLILGVSLWKPRLVGFQVGRIFQHWRMVLVILVLNIAVIGGYRLIAGSTPYTGIDLLINEVLTVPLVEEIFWRGVIFAALLVILRKFLPEGSSGILAGVFIGICFGLLHSVNALFGYPPAFVALQTANATVWGVVYGIARAKTDSIYPPILFHAAMNLVVALG